MLRFDPGDGRIATTRTFAVSEGGGEYNVARGLRRCFGLRTGDRHGVRRQPGRPAARGSHPPGRRRPELRLAGCRTTASAAACATGSTSSSAASACAPRSAAPTAAAPRRRRCSPGDVDWDAIFGRDGARWFHCGGIFAALSEHAAALALEAMQAARRHGTVVSFDLNYRPSLWQATRRHRGGGRDEPRARRAGRRAARERGGLLGRARLRVDGVDESTPTSTSRLRAAAPAVLDDYPNLRLVATSLREAHTATRQRLERRLQHARRRSSSGRELRGLEIFDRVGGGDSFASGLIYGLLDGRDVATALAYGVAHGALAMTHARRHLDGDARPRSSASCAAAPPASFADAGSSS